MGPWKGPWGTALAALLALPCAALTPLADDPPGDPPARRVRSGLAVLRRTYARIDTNGDGFASAAECARAGIPAPTFVTHDSNRDGFLDADEFTICYRSLLVQAKRSIPADIANEVARVRARARAREEARRRRAPTGGR